MQKRANASRRPREGQDNPEPGFRPGRRKPLLARGSCGLPRRRVAENRPQPPLGLAEVDPLARGVVLDLIAPYSSDREVARFRMVDVDAAHARGGQHREALGELDTLLLGREEIEELALLRVIRTRRIAERRSDAAEAFRKQLFIRELRPRLVPLAAGDLVEVFGERLCQAIRERLDDDRAVVVVLGLE